ncbi:16S rRNA (adenine(1518)-N(6)/adenine(1519)-N(6))-dimethyltransferase RsmA [Pseudomonadota bacterium]|jgi:16S rRNA (adenine1518-N6/adenine1519-N6)-dimethyltransferase|nr:16S rRNA (adenine(1518)-N(6)/adenine(1519)-N(6))-dimethyltransferase RsmA [Pseudomonadota bacterium]|tara:strand:+ start:1536 stop:2303 length:768 start_codon:yes stop_codon:yes gene_type:complete
MNDRAHRRKLGQNYLIDPVILFEMERAISPQKNNLFFEIGPGTGALTEHLMGHNRQIIAMDLDQKNIIVLTERFPKAEHEFIHGDVLKEPLDFLYKAKHRVVGNLPYNISTQIIIKLINYLSGIEDMHFLVQKEVAHRICASNKSGDWGRLGVKIAALFKTTILFDVPPESFDIKPKVQSSFIRLIPRVNPMIALNKFSRFSNLVDQSFANKRKGIKNNLKKLAIDFEDLNINPLARAEELSIEDFISVFQTIDS